MSASRMRPDDARMGGAADASTSADQAEQFLPVDPTSPQFTARAVLTGMLLGAVLSVSNLYIAFKVGLGINMSIAAALVGYGVWAAAHWLSFGRVRALHLLENNINQTAASAGASASSAVLVTAIPPLTVLTGQTLAWPALSFWVFSVCLVGIVVAVGWRRQLLTVEHLRFPVGAASAEMLRGLHGRGQNALGRVGLLLGGGMISATVVVLLRHLKFHLVALPGNLLAFRLTNLTFGFLPSPLLLGLGGLIGMRACTSMLLGAIVAYGIVPVNLVANEIVAVLISDDGVPRLDTAYLRSWLVWPGVAVMVTASLVGLVFSWRVVASTLTRSMFGGQVRTPLGAVSREAYVIVTIIVLLLSVTLQVALFQIAVWAALLGVLMSFVLALVAARVSGETGITPVGSIGKVTQLTLGAIAPQSPACNLMTANVTGGAASQCADLLHDFKSGLLLGAMPRWQALAQVCGAVAGSTAGCGAYLLLFPDPATDLFTPEFPAPAATIWLHVAELIRDGLAALPPGAQRGMIVAVVSAGVFTIIEKTLPKHAARWIPNGAAFGIAFVLPASIPLTMFVGASVAAVIRWRAAGWAQQHLVTICTAIIAGDVLASVTLKAWQALAS